MLGYPEKQATLVNGGNVGGTFNLEKAGAKVTMVNAVHGSELVPPMCKPKAEGDAAALDARGLGDRMVEMKPGETRGF